MNGLPIRKQRLDLRRGILGQDYGGQGRGRRLRHAALLYHEGANNNLPLAANLGHRGGNYEPSALWRRVSPAGDHIISRTATGGTRRARRLPPAPSGCALRASRSEEHTSELQSLMRISYAVFCLKKKNI